MTVDYIGFAYAATVAAGGIIGYAKAGMNNVQLFVSFIDNSIICTYIY